MIYETDFKVYSSIYFGYVFGLGRGSLCMIFMILVSLENVKKCVWVAVRLPQTVNCPAKMRPKL